MTKTKTKKKVQALPSNVRYQLASMMLNSSLLRRESLSKILDPRRDIDDECGYPKDITSTQYRYLYDREGVAKRVVAVYPEESWTVDPEIYETEEADDTEFEKVWKDLRDEMNVFHYLHRIDLLSGIGRFGILLLGFDDGKSLDQPVEGIDEKGEKIGKAEGRKLLYFRAYDESKVTIKTTETDQNNPRFGYPTMYTIQLEGNSTNVKTLKSLDVHWTRVIHIADNRETSEVLGTPRMQDVYNRLYDIRKLAGGSAEMFWKGAFPGYSFEVNPDIGDATLDTTSLREEMEEFMNGLQRYLALEGVTAKSLAPQVSDPSNHINSQLKLIAISLSIPYRILFGSEEAKLASTQDSKTWNKRISRRQTKYVTPMIIRPLIDRLIATGVLPEVETYEVSWPDLNTPTDEDKAKVAETRTKALAQYVSGSVDQLIPPKEFLTMIMDMETEEAEAIIEAADEYADDQVDEEEDLIPPTPPAAPVEPAEEPPVEEV